MRSMYFFDKGNAASVIKSKSVAADDAVQKVLSSVDLLQNQTAKAVAVRPDNTSNKEAQEVLLKFLAQTKNIINGTPLSNDKKNDDKVDALPSNSSLKGPGF